MSENDPWKDVDSEMLEAYDGWFRCYRAAAVDAARAAEATQHQQEIAAKNAEIDRCDNKIDALRFSATELLARLAAVEAERDNLKNRIIDLGARVAMADEERTEAATLRAERDRLKAALSASEARIYPDVNFERYLDDTSSTLVELVNDLSDGGDEHAAAAIQQATEAISHLRRTRDELRLDLERIARAALSGEGTKP